jgi:cytochrome c biogenesis protein CcdA/glutaredoxin
MNYKRILTIITLCLIIPPLFLLSSPVSGMDTRPQETESVNIYFFWGEGCPHCTVAKPILEDYANQNPQVKLHDFEIYNDEANLELFFEFHEAYGIEPRGVPTFFVADQHWIGYSPNVQAELEETAENCLLTTCPDLGSGLISADSPLTGTPTEAIVTPQEDPLATETPASEAVEVNSPNEDREETGFSLPLIGNIDLSKQSLLVSTIIISFIDGFNPCSLWVLSILLSITLQSGSRKKVFIVGSVFLIVTAALYGLFIAGVFSVLRIISFMGWIQVIVALIALGFALVNIKDYFWYKQGVSFTISDDKKPGIYKRMRGILKNSDSSWRLIGATIVFAAGIGLVELSCTAGFPVIWSNLLASQEVTALTFVLLLLVYMLIYLLDEMGVFLVAVFTLRSSKLEEKHGRVLKLVGGMLMLTLAVVMLVDPSIMNNITSSLIIFGVSLGLTGLVLLVHRVILPKITHADSTDK